MATFLQLIGVPFSSQSFTSYYFRHPKGELWLSVDSNLSFNLTPPGGGRQVVSFSRDEGDEFLYLRGPEGELVNADRNKVLATAAGQASRGLMCINPRNVNTFSISAFDGSGSVAYTVGSVISLAPFRSFPDVILNMTLVHEGSDGYGGGGHDGYGGSRGGYDEYGGSGGGYGGFGGSGGY